MQHGKPVSYTHLDVYKRQSKDSQNNQFTNEDRHIIPANKEVQASEAVQKDALAQAVITMGSSEQYTTVMPKLSQMSVFWTESAALMRPCSGDYDFSRAASK